MRLKVVYTVHERLPDGSYGSSSTHVARSISGVSRPAEQGNEDSDIASTYLKSCLALICYTRPDLIPDAGTDYSVSVLDIVESAGGNGRIFEGQGMMGWILAEQNAGNTCIAGKLQRAPSQKDTQESGSSSAPLVEDVLEVVLELKPRKPIPRKDFLSTLASSTQAPPPVQAEPAPTSQTMTLPNGSTVDSSAMLAMLQTLFTAAAGASPASGASPETALESANEQARQLGNALGATMPLLPGINLFNPAQAKALQQQLSQQSSSSTQAFPLAKLRAKAKPSALNLHSSHGSTSSNGHPMSEGQNGMGNFTFPGKAVPGRGNSEKRQKSSHAASSSAHPASEPMHRPTHQVDNRHRYGRRMKYWAAGCLMCSKTESLGWRVKQTRKKALDGTVLDPGMLPEDGQVLKLCEECAQQLPSKQNKKKRKAAASIDESLYSDAGLPSYNPDNPGHRANLPHTSPLRRSPRRHMSSSLNRSSLLSAQPVTSPTGLGSRSSSTGGPFAGKRRKFTTALSAAALREENKTAEGLTPDEGSLLAQIPSFKHQLNGKDAVFDIGESVQANGAYGISAPTLDDVKPTANDAPISHEDESFNFFLNASPGAIMRSFNIMSPKKNSTPTNDLSSAATLKGFPNIGLSPLQSRILASESQGTSAVFSPLGSSLSTPFRALLNPGSKGRERATSEQPPASHSRLMEELVCRDTDRDGPQQILNVPQKNNGTGVPQFLSSDDNLLGAASNVQINLLPATADKRQGGKETLNNDQLLSDSIMNDFNTFLLNSSTGLFSPTPFIPKPDNAGKPALAPLTLPYDTMKQQSLSPLAILSSEMDIDLSNLPPSSPPPLPGSNTTQHMSSNSIANVENFWSNFNAGFANNGNYLASNKGGMNGGQLDDGQSPISITTTVTQGGTPQDLPISHDTGPSEPGRSQQEDKMIFGQTATSLSRPATARTGTASSFNTESPVSLLDTDSIQDPLFEYFAFVEDVRNGSTNDYASHQRQSSASSVSSAFLAKLKKSAAGQEGHGGGRSSSSNMAMTWSDSTAASSSSLTSLPETDLTARSKILQKQKALEEAKRTNVPINSAVLENTIDVLFDLDD